MYDFQMGRIAKNRAKLSATRPHCAALFGSLFPEEELQNASPAFIPTPGKLRRRPANMDQANRTANLLASDTVSENAIWLVTAISKKRAGELKIREKDWKKAGAPKTISPALTAPGRRETEDYFASKTKYYATLFALNELTAHQAVHAPGFHWDSGYERALRVSSDSLNKILDRLPETITVPLQVYLERFLYEQIENSNPRALTKPGMVNLIPPARATLAEMHLRNAATDPEYLNQLVLFDLETQRKNVQALNPTNPHFQKVLDRLEVVRQAAKSLGLEK